MATTIASALSQASILPSQARGRLNSSIALPNDTWVKIALDALDFGTDDITLSNGFLVFATAGIYLLELAVDVAVTGAPTTPYLKVGVGDVVDDIWREDDMPVPAGADYAPSRLFVVRIGVGDTLCPFVSYEAGGAPTVVCDSATLLAARFGNRI